ncbi:tellurite resistance/C4-dicarboxylate transporter family protein [Candidatus Binatia bacterium]|nr:tellurite resistance/C4-dicarboxylate transporter family protein [Candidatus Binatia bacterium]
MAGGRSERIESVTDTGGGLATLDPVYFALVMATGIVSIASCLLGLTAVGLALLAVNAVAYVVLWALYLARLARFPRRVLSDLTDHARGAGYFTVVAGTCVLGAQCVVVVDQPRIATALWVLAAAIHVPLIYAVFGSFTTRRRKPDVEHGLNGGWLVAVVATQGVSLLGGKIAGQFPGAAHEILFLTLVFWLAGGMLYIWIISMIFERYMFVALDPSELSPPYWIDMGAVAISTLAGDVLIANAAHDALLGRLRPFLEGLTLLFWATATAWIPMLVVLGVWRHLVRRFPLAYNPGFWGMVFPLGMYTTCTIELAQVIDEPFLMAIPRLFVWFALAAWAATFAGLVVEGGSAAMRRRTSPRTR